MFKESVATIPSIWASINSWLTPTILFVLLNVMIGTIAFISTLTNQNNHQHNQQKQQQQQQQQEDHSQNKISKSPSLLQRVKSINFYKSQEESSPNLTTSVDKLSPDSNTLFNLETLVNPSHYIFEQPHLDNQGNNNIVNMQYNYYRENPLEINTLYNFEHTHQMETNENPSYYSFEQPHDQDNEADVTNLQYNNVFQGNAHQRDTQYFFEQTHAGKVQESITQYVFEQTHERKALETSNQFGIGEKNQADSEEEHEEEEEEVGELQSLDEVYSKLTGHGHHVSRTKSDTEPASGEVPGRLPTKMRKSASLKSPFGHFEEEDIVEIRRPATVRERGARVTEADHEVDAKADDFINKFKNQLKLQRLDSIIRYKDMVNKGSEK